MSSPLAVSWTLVLAAALLGAACQPSSDAAESDTSGSDVPESDASQRPARRAQAEEQACGGIAGFPCPEGYTCVDDPRDDCDPSQHGADCIGVCVKEKPSPPRCTGQEPQRRYISHDAEQCAAIRFVCDTGQRPFFDECGCGCEPES